MRLRTMIAFCGVLLLGLGGLESQAENPDLRDFMRAKLKHSQKALEGLVRDDMESVVQAAQEMKLLSLDTTWQVLQTEKYVDFSRQFRMDVEALSNAAKKNNLELATSAFNGVTTRCVECHKYVRDVRMAKN